MSILSKLFHFQPLPPLPALGIRSATGFPRAAIAAYFRRAGLFGSESDLSKAEQFVVQSCLGSLPGVPVPTSDTTASHMSQPNLRLLGDHVDALVAGRDTRTSTNMLREWGFSPAALSEIERTVQNVQDIFGPRAKPSRADVHEIVIENVGMARAA